MSPSCDDIDLASVYSEFCDTVAYKTSFLLMFSYRMLFCFEACLTSSLWPVL